MKGIGQMESLFLAMAVSIFIAPAIYYVAKFFTYLVSLGTVGSVILYLITVIFMKIAVDETF